MSILILKKEKAMARISKEKKAEIRSKIITTSRVFFLENGYDNTSTSKIAKEVGIAEGTLFNYFKTKTDLFLEVMAEDYFELDDVDYKYESSVDVVDILMDFMNNILKKLLLIPKRVMIEISIALLGKVKTKPETVKKLIELDFKFMEELIVLIKKSEKSNISFLI